MFVFSVARPFVCGCHIISTVPSARTIPGLPGSLASLLHRVARTHLGAMGWNQCAFAPIVRARPFPIFGRPVHPWDRSRRLRPGGSPHALQTPPRGGRPALQSFRRWLQLCLGRIRLSPSCPFRHLLYLPTLRPVRHYPHLLDIDPWPRAERDFNPPETRAARHALWRSQTSPGRTRPSCGLGLHGPASIFRPRHPGDLPVLVHVVSQRARGLRLRRTGEPLASSAAHRVAFRNQDYVGILKQGFSKLNSPAH